MRILTNFYSVVKRVFVAGGMLLVIFGSTSVAQQAHLTLPELVQRQTPEPLLQIEFAELLPDSLPEVVQKADLVIRGRVDSVYTYLSDDKVSLYTDYTIQPLRVLQRKTAVPGTVEKPEPIIVKRWGGETTINNVRVRLEHAHFRAFEQGEQLLLMLTYNAKDKKYVIAGGGAFSVRGDAIHPVIDHPRHHAVDGMHVEQFASEIAKLNTIR